MTTDADLILQMHLFPTEAGGRHSGTPEHSFKCIFKIFGELYDCQLVLEETGSIKPGQYATVPVRLLSPDLLRNRLECGQEVKLCDGLREVGEGKIIEVLPNGCPQK